MKGKNFRAPSPCRNFSYMSVKRDSRIDVDRRFPRLIWFDMNCLLACLVQDAFKCSNTRDKNWTRGYVYCTWPYIHIAHMFFEILITSFAANSVDRKRQAYCRWRFCFAERITCRHLYKFCIGELNLYLKKLHYLSLIYQILYPFLWRNIKILCDCAFYSMCCMCCSKLGLIS
jgi:hypothetical protein